MAKNFTGADLIPWAGGLAIQGAVTADDLVLAELPWQKAGRTWTATGYGKKIPSRFKISFNGRLYRVYITCYSNVGSHWFTARGQLIHVRE